jgi:carboxymethylenebutenolidase
MTTRLATLRNGGLRAFLSTPAQSTTAGVLLLPAIYGLEGRIERYCSWFNEAGIASVVWDPFAAYDLDIPRNERMQIALEQTHDEQARSEQMVWLDYMRRELALQRIAVMGFCTGGRMALTLSAADTDLAACIAYHPSIVVPMRPTHMDAIAAAKQMRCPVLAFYPGGDHVTQAETFNELRQALESRSAPTLSGMFPQADHGFSEIADSGSTQRGLRENVANARGLELADPATMALLRPCLFDP